MGIETFVEEETRPFAPELGFVGDAGQALESRLDQTLFIGVGGRCPETRIVVFDGLPAVDAGAELDGLVGVEATRSQSAGLFTTGTPTVDEASDVSAVLIVHSG